MKALSVILVFVCFLSLFLLCHGPVLFQDRQFGFRDAAYFYYPLHQRVQEEWNHGRWPLWEPEENGGMPILGNPTAAVLYPGKLVFAALPYAWAARIYIVMHTALAFAAMLVLLRSWRISWSGSGLGALSYTFGAPILFQYCNVIYLVGAAWLPLGVHAVDRWVRLGRRWALWELALVLAMQVLGGDPQAAYLLGLSGAGYALGLAWSRAPKSRRQAQNLDSRFPRAFIAIPAVLVWAAVTVAMGVWLPKLRESHYGRPAPPLKWMPWMPVIVAVAWGLAGVAFCSYFYYRRRRGQRLPLAAMWLGLVLAAAVAASITAAQLFPVVEFIQLTSRAASGAAGIYGFSVEPYRLAEVIWPNIGGLKHGENSYWAESIRIPGVNPRIWVPSLYVGGLTVVLAVCSLTLRRGPPWRVWFSVIAVVSSLGARGVHQPDLGGAAGIAMVRWPALERLAAELGPVDHIGDSPIRQDGFLRDGDGSIYWWLATCLPGFREFRFPGKLFTFTALALSALAALGWDDCCAGRNRRAVFATSVLIVISVCVLAGVALARGPILAVFSRSVSTSEIGPLNPAKGFEAIVRSLVHCLLVLGLGLLLIKMARARPHAAGAAALIVMALDLAAANSGYVMTVEQSLFEGKPELAQIIEKAEAQRDPPVPGPFRVHRMPAWNPVAWKSTASADRARDYVVWERATLRSKFGINFGIEYTHTQGVAELYDHDWYFSGFLSTVIGPATARQLGTTAGTKVIYYPRRAYDVWNTRYFVVPANASGWRDPARASAAFRFATELIYPEKGRFAGPGGQEEAAKWIEQQDFELLRNEQEFPRSWVVHEARAIRPGEELPGDPRARTRTEILFARDPFWNDPALTLFDPRRIAWLNRADLASIAPKLSHQPPAKSESVQVSYPNPQRAVLDVTLESTGLVVLSDVYYPGWQLTIDGEPAPIIRVNILMRRALVTAGRHRLVYSFAPGSFHAGFVVSIVGLGGWALLGVFCWFRPVHAVLVAGGDG